MQVVYEDDDVLVGANLLGHDVVVITFSHVDYYENEPTYWGVSALAKIGLSSIGVVCKRNAWFRKTSMKAPLDAVRGIASSFDKRISYGFSMGGYGALKFAKYLEIDVALALSPQVSIDPGYFQDKRFERFFNAAWHTGMEIKSEDLPPKAYMIYDPVERMDTENVRRLCEIGADKDVVAITCHHVGHDTPLVLASTVTLGRVLPHVVSRSDDELAMSIKQARRVTGRRITGLALRMIHKKPSLADAIVSKYASIMGPFWVERYNRDRAAADPVCPT